MLQQILTDMFIEPDLLAELNEEQKQVLFMKMRMEQVRRWKEREARLEKEENRMNTTKKVPSKSVTWLTGRDSDVWVWVMGEHPADKPYHQICNEVLAERAAQQAQQEANELRSKKEAELEKRFSAMLADPELLSRREQEQREQEQREQQQEQQQREQQEQQQEQRQQEQQQEQRQQEQQQQEQQQEQRQQEQQQQEQQQERVRQAAAQEQMRLEEEIKKRESEERRIAEEEVRRLEEERKKQIYMDLREMKEEREDKHWQETLRKSKAADLRRRSIAKQTREDDRRRSVKALERGRVAATAKVFGGEKPALPPKPQPRKLTLTSDTLHLKKGVRRTQSTSTRERIIQWYQEEQLPLRAGFDKDHSQIAPWFHGIISRTDAESLLTDGSPGYFLVRVSERILGYVLSYRCKDTVKHFLIDATDGCYTLLGDQLTFSSLAELVQYYEGEPITMSGGEQLLCPCGQKGSVDYSDLFA